MKLGERVLSQVSVTPLRYSFADFLASHGEHIPLDRAMVWMSAEEYPDDVDATEMLVWLDELAAGVCMPPERSRYEALARINYHLFHEQGFAGDSEEYDHPDNSCLAPVLNRRKGLPIVLGALYIEVARRCGVEVHGIGFPGHFFVSPASEGPRFFLDAFSGGRILSEGDLLSRLDLLASRAVPRREALAFLEPVDNRAILVRMNCNLKRSYLVRQHWVGALRAVDRILLLAPGRLDDIRDRGFILAKIGRYTEAATTLDYYLSARPDADDKDIVMSQLADIRKRVFISLRR